jgi:hypothetical protein
MSRIRALFLASLITLAGASSGRGQATPSSPAPGCTYMTCAVRVDTRFFGRRLVQGANGDPVGKPLGGFGGGVDILLAGPDSAAVHARRYKNNVSTSTTLTLLSALAFFAASSQIDDSDSETGPLAALTGLGFAIASIPFTLRSQRDLSRSVWWYNSALPR